MNVDSFVSLLLKTGSYPIGLSNKVGYELSIITYFLLQKFGFSFVSENTFIEKFRLIAKDKSIKDMENSNLIIRKDSKIAINISFFEEHDDFSSIEVAPTRSKELSLAVKRYKDMCIKKGRPNAASHQRIEEILKKFKNEEDAIFSLNYSIEQGFITIYERTDRRSPTENKNSNGVWDRGGETNRTRERDKRKGKEVYKGFVDFE